MKRRERSYSFVYVASSDKIKTQKKMLIDSRYEPVALLFTVFFFSLLFFYVVFAWMKTSCPPSRFSCPCSSATDSTSAFTFSFSLYALLPSLARRLLFIWFFKEKKKNVFSFSLHLLIVQNSTISVCLFVLVWKRQVSEVESHIQKFAHSYNGISIEEKPTSYSAPSSPVYSAYKSIHTQHR